MAPLTSTLAHNDSTAILGLKGFAVGTCVFIAGSMVTTSAQFMPALILASQQKDKKPDSSQSGKGSIYKSPGSDMDADSL